MDHQHQQLPLAVPLTPQQEKQRRAERKRAIQAATRLMKQATNHGSWVYKVAHFMSVPVIIAISFGAFIILTGATVVDIVRHGASVIEIGKLASTLLLLLGADLSFAAALLRLQNALERGIPFRQQIVDWAMVLLQGFMETWTYYLMLTGLDHATTMIATDQMNYLRAASGISSAAYLTMLRKPQPGPKDFVRTAGNRANEMALTKLEQTEIDDTSMGVIYRIGAIAGDETLSEQDRALQLVDAFEQLEPGTLRKQYDAEKTEMRLAYEQERTQMQDTLDTTRRELQQMLYEREQAEMQTMELVVERTMEALLQALSTRTLPEWIVERRPNLASLDLETLIGGARKSAVRQLAEARPRSEKDRQQKCLRDAGVSELVDAPQGRNGAWVSARNVAQLTDGKVAGDAARALIKSLELSGAKSGNQVVARFQVVMDDLAIKGLLSDQARVAYDRYRNSGEVVDADSEEASGTESDNLRFRA